MLKRRKCRESMLLGGVSRPKTIASELAHSQGAFVDACIANMIFKLRKRNLRLAVKTAIVKLSSSFRDAQKRSGNGGCLGGKVLILTLGSHLVFASTLMPSIKQTGPTSAKSAHASSSNQILLASVVIRSLKSMKQFMRQTQKGRLWVSQYGKISCL